MSACDRIARRGRVPRVAAFVCALAPAARDAEPPPLMAYALLFASSYFSVITPQGGSQKVIFVASGYLSQRELYRIGLVTTLHFRAVFMTVGTAWLYAVT
jgi:DASS family divalent anion:Na+ symporter